MSIQELFYGKSFEERMRCANGLKPESNNSPLNNLSKDVCFENDFIIKKFIPVRDGFYVINNANTIYDQNGEKLDFKVGDCKKIIASYDKENIFFLKNNQSEIYNQDRKRIYYGAKVYDIACSPDNKLFIQQFDKAILNHYDNIYFYKSLISRFRFSPKGELFIQSQSNKIYDQQDNPLYAGEFINDFKISSSNKLFVWEDKKGIVDNQGKPIYDTKIEQIRSFDISPKGFLFILQGSNTIVNQDEKTIYSTPETIIDFQITPQEEMIIQQSKRLLKIKL